MVYGSFLKLRGLEVSKNCDARRVQGAALEPAVGELCWQSEKPAFNILLPRFLNVYYSFYYHYYYYYSFYYYYYYDYYYCYYYCYCYCYCYYDYYCYYCYYY